MKPLNISLLGSTGSIGLQVLDVCRRLGSSRISVSGLAAWSNAELLIEQAKQFRPKIVCIADEQKAAQVKEALSGLGVRIVCGEEGLRETAVIADAERIIVSVAGTPGLLPTLDAIKAGKDIALASKEVLVAAGHLVMNAARNRNVKILPIDSEHSAIFQCLNGEHGNKIDKIFLTASGGAFRDTPMEDLQKVTAAQALAHPTWKMGKKVTVDSATLMNKGLEIIEAKWLFGVEASDIEVVIHHQSIIHSMVRYADGSVIAQLGLPDMRLPIQYALLYPERPDTGLPRYDPISNGPLTFDRPDLKKFECLMLAGEAARIGGTMAVTMNAADEVAVSLFLKGRIGFLDIPRIISIVMEKHNSSPDPGIELIKEVDAQARRITLDIASGI